MKKVVINVTQDDIDKSIESGWLTNMQFNFSECPITFAAKRYFPNRVSMGWDNLIVNGKEYAYPVPKVAKQFVMDFDNSGQFNKTNFHPAPFSFILEVNDDEILS